MARELSFTHEDTRFSFAIEKVDRSKLYGYTSVETTDENNALCSMASISDDGLHILSKGCVGYTTLSEDGRYIAAKDIVITNKEGEKIEKYPSSFNEDIPLIASTIEEYLQLNVKSIYELTPSEDDVEADETNLLDLLKMNKVLKFRFCYRAGYDADDAFMVHNNEGIFMIIGKQNPFEFIGLEQNNNQQVEEETEDDDFDFGML
ncbi:MAG: hypothetical protein KAG34_02645 [Cocleimonas sp.]|nr:hypothetical protein [Sulfurovaceae bacterium]MCK5917291.1 hypothetical protein [Cocleimonas sp.]